MLACALAFGGNLASGATFTVTTTNGNGPGSLVQAVTDANALPDHDTIEFHIPGDGLHTIVPTLANFLELRNPATIDGKTQPGYEGKPLIEVRKSRFLIGANHCAVRALVLDDYGTMAIWLHAGKSNVIESCYIGTDVTGNAFGDWTRNSVGIDIAAQSAFNVISNCVICANHNYNIVLRGGSSSNVIQGNLIGVLADGTNTFRLWNGPALDFLTSYGILIKGSSYNRIGGMGVREGNVIAGHRVAVQIGHWETQDMTGTVGNLLLGNLIGTDASGSLPLGNNLGVSVWSSGNQIGGPEPGAGNVISTGLSINGSNNVVQGNFIGTDPSGTLDLGHRGQGIIINGTANLIGGAEEGQANLVAFNGVGGIRIESGQSNLLLANRIYANRGLAIELGSDGVTTNDWADLDSGPNSLQNFPVLASVQYDRNRTIVRGSLHSKPQTPFRLEFFSNAQCDPSSSGEGQRFLGSRNITTGPSNAVSFKVTFPFLVSVDDFITATATDPTGNTSEFSPCLQVGEVIHDLAVTQITAPKVITLGETQSMQKVQVAVTIQNRGPLKEVIPDAAALADLVTLHVDSLGSCPDPIPVLVSPTTFPITLASKKKLALSFELLLDCVNNPLQTNSRNPGREDYRYTVTVHCDALDGTPDSHPDDDVCPRPPRFEPYPDGTILDLGCGKKRPDGTYGGEVLTDVVAY